jgi:hypothetical protein
MRRYISDIITPDIISTWQLGQKYLIRSGTGSGKSYWVKNVLYEYCKSKEHKILLLSNRNILKNQNQEDLGAEKLKVIRAENYQKLESLVTDKDRDIYDLISPYRVVVLDEAHFFHTDSQFNRQTDTLLNIIKNPLEDKVLIVITATPEVLLKYYEFPKENTYNISTNYDYIEQLSFYTKEKTPEAIIQNMPDEEKAIYFGDALQAWELKNKFDDSIFICAKGNRLYKKGEVEPNVEEIVKQSMFSAKLLCTTKVLDNGVNLMDADLKTIIIDTVDPITLIQELGRKRVLNENERVRVYIRNQHRGIINFNLMKINDQLKNLADFENMTKEDFVKKYRKKNYADIIDNDLQVNIAKKQNLLYLKDLYDELMKDKDSYKQYICKLLGKNEASNADMELERLSIADILRGLVGVKLYKEEQNKFKLDFFNLIFSPKKTDYRHRALRSINALLEEDNLSYRISSGRDAKGNNRQKRTFWTVIQI